MHERIVFIRLLCGFFHFLFFRFSIFIFPYIVRLRAPICTMHEAFYSHSPLPSLFLCPPIATVRDPIPFLRGNVTAECKLIETFENKTFHHSRIIEGISRKFAPFGLFSVWVLYMSARKQWTVNGIIAGWYLSQALNQTKQRHEGIMRVHIANTHLYICMYWKCNSIERYAKYIISKLPKIISG